MSTLLLLLACLSAHRAPLYDPGAHLPPPALGQVFEGQDPEAVFQEAVERRRAGDVEGAVHRLAWLHESGDRSPEVLYQLGIAYEMNEDFETALSIYDLILAEHPELPLRDAGFRRALCLEELGRYDEALRQYKAIPQEQGFDRHDRYTLDLAMGIAALRAGRTRQGLRLIETSLLAVEDSREITWMAAKGRYALMDHALAQAADRPLEGSERKQVHNLEDRADLMAEAEAHLVKIIAQEEPEWIMAGLLSLGDAYMELHDAVAGAPAPRGLDADQTAVYRQELERRSTVLLRKAWEAYDQGLVVAGRFGVENRYTAQLTEARDAIPLP
ncbi:MAG: tetratricopeptide repeat protein [Alphaproteobacteria bacterium]|nr:tetratricopeptide repeat protein [Alphaproteobacteria bacterium]